MTDSTGFIDLDSVVSEDIRVTLDEVEYRLPGDPPTENLLRVSLLADEIQRLMRQPEVDGDKLLQMREELTEEVNALFAMRASNRVEGEEPQIHLSDRQIGALLDGLFAHYFRPQDEEEGDDADPPTQPEEASTPPKRRSSRPSARKSGSTRTRAKAAASGS